MDFLSPQINKTALSLYPIALSALHKHGLRTFHPVILFCESVGHLNVKGQHSVAWMFSLYQNFASGFSNRPFAYTSIWPTLGMSMGSCVCRSFSLANTEHLVWNGCWTVFPSWLENNSSWTASRVFGQHRCIAQSYDVVVDVRRQYWYVCHRIIQ